MKNRAEREPAEQMWPEYDFRAGVRGKYAQRYARGTDVVGLGRAEENAKTRKSEDAKDEVTGKAG